MKKLALSLAVGAAALLGASAVNAAPAQSQPQAPVTAHDDTGAQSTDMSSRHRRHWRHRHYHHRHWGYYRPYHRGYYRPAYRSYGYYPGYYRPAPVISFGFGVGPRWGHRHYW